MLAPNERLLAAVPPVDGDGCVLPVVCGVAAWPHELGNAEVLALDPEAVRCIDAVIHHAAAVSGLHGNRVIAARGKGTVDIKQAVHGMQIGSGARQSAEHACRLKYCKYT